ncbi:LysR family transcriptional regulator [Labilibaculum sp. K2S]|uniref:winged helix-turn-helix domain-containing protein n=1 Tax=Labilibaculum sp. K2S TaxID=3056386 RepID=UPI0025A3AF99|nr:LysR family transcriptional regulator [Labilibaculum sp. K2S]MDM8158582.1 LysR family transcriptional regulator [Labilibaculum sp. K2S]
MELLIKGALSIETEDGFVINPKVILLLSEIEKTGSLNAAVNNIGMSYSYAWNMLNKTNCKLNTPMLISRKGGNGGGVANLTEAGQKLLNYCRKLESDFQKFVGTHKVKLTS